MQPAYKLIKQMLNTGGPIHEVERQLKRNRYNVRMPLSELYVENDVLYRRMNNVYVELTNVVILPPEYCQKAITVAHSSPTAGHGGTKVTLARCIKFFFGQG